MNCSLIPELAEVDKQEASSMKVDCKGQGDLAMKAILLLSPPGKMLLTFSCNSFTEENIVIRTED